VRGNDELFDARVSVHAKLPGDAKHVANTIIIGSDHLGCCAQKTSASLLVTAISATWFAMRSMLDPS